jgi:hypothetical protein
MQGETAEEPAPGRTPGLQKVLTGDDEASLVAQDLLGQPPRMGLGADEDEQGGRRDGLG